ncbi:hypothetical protein SCYZ1_58 [Pseudomonas phage SCYZ1]|nr:hypothetical protein SCYZ1_58 [Pseudomonas phage SCYZ1]
MEKMGYGIWLSERVRELLDEGTLPQLFQAVEDDLKGEWLSSPPGDVELRERIYNQIHALGLVRLRMEILVNDLKFRND